VDVAGVASCATTSAVVLDVDVVGGVESCVVAGAI
jgi:hypothetical protein